MKETLFPQRKLILRDKKSGTYTRVYIRAYSSNIFRVLGEFYDDFSGAECPTGIWNIHYNYT